MGARLGTVERDGDTIVWEYRVPLLTNRFLVRDMVGIALVGLVVMACLVGGMGVLTGEGIVLLPPVVYLVGAGAVLGLFAIAALLLCNGYWATFGVTPEGVTYASGGKGRALNRAAAVAGALAGSPAVAGTGLLAMGREDVLSAWADVRRVVVHRRARIVVVRDSWHAVQRLHCAELLDDVVEAIRANWARAAEGPIEIVER
jgi:hypothetical protein